jgi:dipeptidase D
VKALAHTLAIALDRLGDESAGELSVVALRGGRADNAIPREAEASLLVGDAGLAALQEAARDVQARVRAWRAEVDDEARVDVADDDGDGRAARVLAPAMAMRVVDLLVALPSGVVAMDEQLPGTVRTSANLGIVTTDADGVTITSSPRSSRASDLDALHARYASYARLAGAGVEVTSRYPAWAPDFGNQLLDVVRAAYRDVHDREPNVTAVHAGLEAGELASHLPGLLAVSIGPTVRGAHGPGERLEIASVGRFDALVRRILARLAAGAQASQEAQP